jgi:hypothetical protein
MLRSFDLEKEIFLRIIILINPVYSIEEIHIRSTNHKILRTIPCHIEFGKDMIHNISFKEILIKSRKGERLHYISNERENKSCMPYKCKVGDQVLS